ncbi:hypothetical protein BLA29_012217, partial [Euroglyphus maynei]
TDEKKPDDHDTVGSVAVDWFGNFAAATSTGGITGKLPGRIGDSPVIGSGAYADNEIGAVSTTGHGEAIMKVCLARDVLYRYEKLMNQSNEEMNPMQRAIIESLDTMQQRVDGYGGIIAIGNGHGDIGFGFNTQAMPWAYITVDDNDLEQIMANMDKSNDIQLLMERIQIKIHYGYNRNEHLEIIE